MFDWVNGKFTWVEDYIPRKLSIGNGTPCIYLAIEEKYQHDRRYIMDGPDKY